MYSRRPSVLWSVFAAIALMVGLGTTLFVTFVLFRGDDAIKEDSDTAAQSTDCHFTAQAEQLVLYHAPISAPSQQKATLLGQELYPIIAQNRGYYLLQATEETTGWADSREGVVEGDCEEIPVDETALPEFPTVCTFTSTDEASLYSEAELLTPGETLRPGTHLVESASTESYYLVLDNGVGGWVAAADGQLGENCDSITVVQGG